MVEEWLLAVTFLTVELIANLALAARPDSKVKPDVADD
jgi:hypothetical protein